jgi:hypothetical protein
MRFKKLRLCLLLALGVTLGAVLPSTGASQWWCGDNADQCGDCWEELIPWTLWCCKNLPANKCREGSRRWCSCSNSGGGHNWEYKYVDDKTPPCQYPSGPSCLNL